MSTENWTWYRKPGRWLARKLGYELYRSGEKLYRFRENVRDVYAVYETESEFGRLFFAIQNHQDPMQAGYGEGHIYEEEELRLIAEFFPGGHFVDVGANVGNHTVCMASLDRTEKVTSIEPNSGILPLLAQNVALNGVWSKVAIFDVALSEKPGVAQLQVPLINLGGASLGTIRPGMNADYAVEVTVLTGDELLAGQRVDFLKIDVEGHEIACLKGLRQTIETSRPPVFIEVGEESRAEVENWFDELDYSLATEHRSYETISNLIFTPKGATPNSSLEENES